MAAGKFIMGKASGGVLNITSTDGATSTDLVLPLSGTVATTITSPTTNALGKINADGTIGNSNIISDANGNVGIGVTPSASGSTTHGIQTEYNYMGSQGGSSQIMYNAVPSGNSSSKYVQSSLQAVSYEQNSSGQHVWRTAPSGTAGNAISWTNAVTLVASGNLLVGTSTDNGVDKLQVKGSISSGIVRIVSDLNNITSAGVFLTGDFTFSMAANAPCNYGTLHQIARSTVECTQMVQDIVSNSLFVRGYTGSAWSAWHEK